MTGFSSKKVSKKEYKSFPTVLSKIHPVRNTPHLSIFTITLLTILFTLPGDIGLVAGLTNVFLLAVFALVNASLLKLRFENLEPGIDRDFTAPINVGKVSLTAVSGLVSSMILILFYIYQQLI